MCLGAPLRQAILIVRQSVRQSARQYLVFSPVSYISLWLGNKSISFGLSKVVLKEFAKGGKVKSRFNSTNRGTCNRTIKRTGKIRGGYPVIWKLQLKVNELTRRKTKERGSVQ
ncbi:hypothetical protein GW17_00032222 [Ensete ventricosum]|nr:hypothetical protein GW17_00032222 [Ensete ventricosum]RZR99537.1 hypothetical protein BHM03_00029102 [Ensete ventricosum]